MEYIIEYDAGNYALPGANGLVNEFIWCIVGTSVRVVIVQKTLK